jgi:hypothetical protein
VDKYLSGTLPIENGLKQGDVLSPFLSNVALEYTVKMVHVNQDGFKLNGTYQLVVYADDVNTLGRSDYTLKKNTETLLVANNEIWLERSADKTKYMVMARDQNA